DRRRVAADGDRLACRFKSARRAEGQLLPLALIRNEVHLAENVADNQVQGAVAVPVDGERSRGAADVERFAGTVLQYLSGGEGAVGLAAEEVDFARPRAGDDVRATVAVQVHQLWSEADASADRDRRNRATRLEPHVRLELRLSARAGV